MKDEMEKLIEERGICYGDYEGGTKFRMDAMKLITDRHYEVHGIGMMPVEWCFLWDIVNKISRLAVTPSHVDSWTDIIGYSTLILDIIQKHKSNL